MSIKNDTDRNVGTLYRFHWGDYDNTNDLINVFIGMVVETKPSVFGFEHIILDENGKLFTAISDTVILEEDSYWKECCEKVNL